MLKKVEHITKSKLFIIGCVIKIVLASLFASDYLSQLFIPFINQFITHPFHNPYTFFVEKGMPQSFPYPPLMIYVLSTVKVIVTPLIAWLPLPNPEIVSVRGALFLADCMLLYTMTKMSLNHTKKVLLFYWLNPILIYITYIHGQLDVIPICFLFMATYVMYKHQFRLSALLLALGCLTKTHLFLVFPLFLMLIPKSKDLFKQVGIYITIFAGVVVIGNLPYWSPSYFEMVYQNKEQAKLFLIHIPMIKGFTLYVIPAVILLLYIRFFSLKTKGREVFCAFLVFCYASLLLFIPPMQGWYYWIIPFLVITCVHNQLRTAVITVGLTVAYFIYFGVTLQSDYFQIFQWVSPNIALVPSPISYVMQWSPTMVPLLQNIAFTLLQTVLLAICVWVYYVITHTISFNKMSSQPFLIGISGDSSTGKTTLSQLINNIFGKNQSMTIYGDDLHCWERGHEKWSDITHLNPKANHLYNEVTTINSLINGKAIQRKHYKLLP